MSEDLKGPVSRCWLRALAWLEKVWEPRYGQVEAPNFTAEMLAKFAEVVSHDLHMANHDLLLANDRLRSKLEDSKSAYKRLHDAVAEERGKLEEEVEAAMKLRDGYKRENERLKLLTGEAVYAKHEAAGVNVPVVSAVAFERLRSRLERAEKALRAVLKVAGKLHENADAEGHQWEADDAESILRLAHEALREFDAEGDGYTPEMFRAARRKAHEEGERDE